MRTLLVFACAIVVWATAGTAGSAVGSPALRVLDREPLVVRGTGFKARERVVLSAFSPGGTSVRRLVTTSTGTFTARFEQTFGSCTGVRALRAVGARSGVVTLRALPMTRECPPPAP